MRTAAQHIVIDARNRRSSTGRYTDRLLEHLQSISHGTNYRFTILLQPDDPWTAQADNFSTQACPFPQFSFNPLNDIRFSYLLNKLKPDLVHFTMTQQPLSFRGNIVTTTHDLTMLRFVRAGKSPTLIFKLKKLGYRLLFYVAHQKSHRIIVPTEFVKQDLSDYYPFTSERITVTYESSEPPIVNEAIQPEGMTNPFIMHVGSPFPHKNLFHLIKAFEELQKTYPDLELVLAGKKEFYFNELEEWVRTRSSFKSIHFTGFVSDEELKWYYQNAQAYVLPSLSEGFGLPGLEAMSHGCPLISSNATCLPEVYGNAAQFFNPNDLDETVNAIGSVISNEKHRQKLISAGYKQIEKFSWSRMAEQTFRVYKQSL